MTFPSQVRTRSQPFFTLYKLPRRITDGLLPPTCLPTRGLISDIEPEKEGRASPREERRQYADILTRYPTYPFAFSTYARAGPRVGRRDEKRETAEEEERLLSPLLFFIDNEKSR